MHQRRSQSDTKSTSSINGTLSSTATNPSSPSTGRVSIYHLRERVILSKMTTMMGDIAPDTENEVTSRLHSEVPAIKVDGHLVYCLFFTLQNLIHLNAIYILLYHTVFWLEPNYFQADDTRLARTLEQTKYEQTHFLILSQDTSIERRTSIKTGAIDKQIYLCLLAINLIELVCAFLWTVKKKLPYLMSKNQKFKYRLGKLLVGMIIIIYLTFISWLTYETFLTQRLSPTFFSLLFGHLILLTCLDKPNLFEPSFSQVSRQSGIVRKQQRSSTSSVSGMTTSALNRVSSRSSTSTPLRRVSGNVTAAVPASPWYRWSSVTEDKLDVHKCSLSYTETRQEADDLWPVIVRRIILTFYRTFSSFVLLDIIPIQTLALHVRSTDNQPIKFFIAIFALNTFLTHSAFLFPVKLQTTAHRLATHLGQWRQQSNVRTDTINEWSADCNSYIRGSVVKSNNRDFIAVQHLTNAAHPQSRSHSILYRIFGDLTYVINIQFILCLILVISQVVWILLQRHWEHVLIASAMIFYSVYPIFKIVRDRIVMDFVEDHEYSQTSTTSKQKRSS